MTLTRKYNMTQPNRQYFKIKYRQRILAVMTLLLSFSLVSSLALSQLEHNKSEEVAAEFEPATKNKTEAGLGISVTAGASQNSKLLIAAAEQEQTAPIVSSPPVSSLPQAKSVELNEPVPMPTVTVQENAIAPVVESSAGDNVELVEASVKLPEVETRLVNEEVEPFIILGTEVLPSTSTRLSWSPSQSFEGIATPTPVLIVNGATAGPTLCLTAALHGDELNGIEIVRRILYNLQPKNLVGRVIGVPIVNLQGFRRNSRYLTDRRDLNRYFPGNPTGSSASRIAYSFFTEVINHCDALVDLHTGSFYRTNLPQLRADVSNPKVLELAQNFGSTAVLHSGGALGTLRRAAVDAGIPSVTLEAGVSMTLQEEAVEHGVKGITTLMNQLGMTQKFSLWGAPEPVYYQSIWVRADLGGVLFSTVDLGDQIKVGDVLGIVTDPITNIKDEILSPHNGRIIGKALNQVVLPGFAAFHVGIKAPAKDLITTEQGPDYLSDTAINQPQSDLVETVEGENTTTSVSVAVGTVLPETIMDDTESSGEGIDQQNVPAESINDDYD